MAVKDFGQSKIPAAPSAASNIKDKLQGLSVEKNKTVSEQEPDYPGMVPVFGTRKKHDAWLHIRIPGSVLADIRGFAKKNGVSQSEFIISLVDAFKKCSHLY